MLGATWRFSDFALGAAISVPFGGRVSWPKSDTFAGGSMYPLATDGVQRWHSIEGSLTYIYNSLALAYRLGPLSFGVSANLINSSVSSKKARTLAGNTDTEREGRIGLDVSGVQGSFGIGALFEAIERTLWLSASYQAQPGLGAMRLKGKATVDISGSATYDVTFDQALPDIVRVGARYRPEPAIELRLYGDMTRWSVLKTQCTANAGYPCKVYGSGPQEGADAGGSGSVLLNLRRQWQDTFGLHLGGSDWVSQSLELFAGAGFETAAAPDATLDTELTDGTNVLASVGARIEVGNKWFFGGSLRYLYFFERNNIGKSELAKPLVSTRQPDAGGIYTQWITILNANIEKEF
jgi:long-chain fatty acid transport protein